MKSKYSIDGDSETIKEIPNPLSEQPEVPKPKESSVEKATRELKASLDNLDFIAIHKEEYKKLSNKKGWFKEWISSPTFLNLIFVTIITYGLASIDYGITKYLKKKIKEIDEEKSSSQTPSQ